MKKVFLAVCIFCASAYIMPAAAYEKTTVKVTRETKSDDLGGVTIYFYDPLVEVPALQPHEYNTGTVCFGITAY